LNIYQKNSKYSNTRLDEGQTRDTIARDNSLSTCAVSNLINEWRNALTHPDADALRELEIMHRKSGITATECAQGARVYSILKELGVNQKLFGHFVSEIMIAASLSGFDQTTWFFTRN
jgi:hypothetical protein